MLRDHPIQAYIPASNLDRARKFYEAKLGLVPKDPSDDGVTYEFAEGTTAFMYPSAGAGTSKASTAFWPVDDLDAEMAELKANGVVFEEYDMPGVKTVNGIASSNGNRAAWFKDPEGNIMALIESKPEPR